MACMGRLLRHCWEPIVLPAASAENCPRVYDLKARPPHFAPKAKAVIQLFMNGGPSQVDLFDPKPALQKVRRYSAESRYRERD